MMMTTTTATTGQQTTSGMHGIDDKVKSTRSGRIPKEHARPPVIEATGGYAHESALSSCKSESGEKWQENRQGTK